MAQFNYKARTPDGEARSGIVEARTLDTAIDVLQRSNLIVTEIKPAGDASTVLGRRVKFFDRVKLRDIVIFSRQLSTLFQAKIPVTQALRTLAAETESAPFRAVISEVLDDVSAGSSLSQAMAKHPDVFTRFYVSLIRAGEESGKLEEVFFFLADYLERSFALTSKARNALIYPAFVFAAFIGVIIVMLVVVVPRLTSIFAELGQNVPFYTQLIISLASFLQQWGIAVLMFLAVLGVIAWRFSQSRSGEFFYDELKIHLPLVGGLLKKIYLTRLADNLSTLILAGIPIIRALEITSDVVANRVYQNIILDAADSVKAGNTVSASFEKHPEIPPLLTQMIRVGEESGRLDFILKNASAFYQRDVDNLLENFVSLIEPALIIFLGAGVGILVAAVLVPLYNLSNVL